jgi:RNA polymerase sigma-70 factor (ECF subfamily)
VSDDPVVAAAKDGDPEAWRELYRAHAGRLVVWLAARASSDSAISAEDVAAETWLTAAAKIKTFSGSSHDFGGWLFGIGRKLAANTRHRDARRRTDAVPDVPDLVGLDGIEDQVAGQHRVRALLAELSPRERDVLACLEVVGLDVAQTAEALGMTAVAVRVARHRALNRLRRLVGDDVEVGSPASAAEVPSVS